MAEIVTGTPAVVGFTNGYDGYRNHGWSGKDMQYAASVDRGEQTRDLLASIAATNVAVEKTGAANSLATEKIGAAMELTAEKIGAANTMAVQLASSSMALQLCDVKTMLLSELKDCCCEVRKEIADVKAAVLETDAHRIRDALQQAQVELLMLRSGGHGNGNSARM